MLSRHVLHVGRQNNPGMHALLVDRKRGRWKAGIGKCSYWNGHELWVSLELVMHGGAALWAEVKCGLASCVAGADISRGRACDLHGASTKARLRAKYAACSALAGQAMTDGNAQRFLARSELELTATT